MSVFSFSLHSSLQYLSLSCLMLTVLPLASQEMVIGRGDGNGAFPDQPAPVTIDAAKGALWSADLPRRGKAPMTKVGNTLFVCAEPEWLLAFVADSGKELWRQRVSALQLAHPDKQEKAEPILQKVIDLWDQGKTDKSPEVRAMKNDIKFLEKECGINYVRNWLFYKQGYAVHAPITDGKHVWARFGTGVMACFTMDGKKVWEEMVPDAGNLNTQVGQMVVVDGRVYYKAQCTRDERKADKSADKKIVALDLASGKKVWQSEGFPAGDHALSSGLGLLQVEGANYLVSPGGRVIDMTSGKSLLANLGSWSYGANPAVKENKIVYYDRKEGPYVVTVEKAGEQLEAKGAKEKAHKYGAVDAIYNGQVIVAGPYGLDVYPLADPTQKHSVKFDLPKEDRKGANSLITVVNNLAYAPVGGAHLMVVRLAPKLEIVHQVQFPAPIDGPVLVDDGKLYVKTRQKVYCFK